MGNYTQNATLKSVLGLLYEFTPPYRMEKKSKCFFFNLYTF